MKSSLSKTGAARRHRSSRGQTNGAEVRVADLWRDPRRETDFKTQRCQRTRPLTETPRDCPVDLVPGGTASSKSIFKSPLFIMRSRKRTKIQGIQETTHPLTASCTSRLATQPSNKKWTAHQGRPLPTQRNASSFARSRRRRTHNSAVLRAYGAGGDGETSGAIHASESIGNQEPSRHESSLGQAVDMAADGMPSCATQVRGSSVGTVFTPRRRRPSKRRCCGCFASANERRTKRCVAAFGRSFVELLFWCDWATWRS